jgi:hypothetical protein
VSGRVERAARLAWRHVRSPCARCDGAGTRLYATGSTWRGGAAGQAVTPDVCDLCWGSGDATRPGVDLRELVRAASRRSEASAASLLAARLGGPATAHAPVLRRLAEVLDALPRTLPAETPPFDDACAALAATLRAMAEAVPAPAPTPRAATPRPLTDPQADELGKLLRSRQNTYGKARARVQNALVRLGLARFTDDSGAPADHGTYCEATPAGRAAHEAHLRRAAEAPEAPRVRCRGTDCRKPVALTPTGLLRPHNDLSGAPCAHAMTKPEEAHRADRRNDRP